MSSNVKWSPKLESVKEIKDERMPPHQSRKNRYHPYDDKSRIKSAKPRKTNSFYEIVKDYRQKKGLSPRAIFVGERKTGEPLKKDGK